LAAAQGTVAQLNESLSRAEASAHRESGRVDELSKFKDDVAARQQRFPELVAKLQADATPALAEALRKHDVKLLASDDGVVLTFDGASMFNRQKSAFSWSGRKLSCLPVEQADHVGLSQVTVRAFAASDTAPGDAESAYETSAGLAASVVEQLAQGCKVALADLSIASSAATKGSPVLQFEFRPRAPADGARP
jgi:hypothetical protein